MCCYCPLTANASSGQAPSMPLLLYVTSLLLYVTSLGSVDAAADVFDFRRDKSSIGKIDDAAAGVDVEDFVEVEGSDAVSVP